MKNKGGALAAAILMSAALPSTARAVDGQIAITQATAMAGGVTSGDSPGFPVTISQPGSYVLSGNLTVPNADTTAIEIAASHVTLNLNGFAILGPTDCSGGLNPCAGSGQGVGITTRSVAFNITIRNGTIQGMGGGGIILTGDSHLIEYMHVRSNGGGRAGILIQASTDDGSSIVQHSTVQRNGGLGINVSRGAVRYNVVDVNLSSGIAVSVGSVSYNVVTRNLAGINLGSGAGALGNTARDNPSGNLIGGGANLGQNLCTGAGGGC